VGEAGQTLDALLGDAGLRREDAYVTNVVKCRPPPLERIHGDPSMVGRYTVVPTFHPSSFNRALGRRDQAGADVRTARRALDDGGVP